MLSLLIFILILAFLVLIHEFGHFIAAKKSGVLVEEFGIGFPPRLFSKKIGETIYSINALPLGGFVKLYGEEYDEVNKSGKGEARLAHKRAFAFKKPHIKFLIITAGVFMNLLLAVFIYYILLSANSFRSEPLPIINNYHFRFGQQEGRVVVADVVRDSPAFKAGITTEDAVIKISDLSKTKTEVKTASQMIELIRNKGSQQIIIETENIKNGKKKIIAVTPLYNSQLKRAIIGANLVDGMIISYNDTPTTKLLSGFLHSYNIAAYNINSIGFLFSSSIKEKNLEPVSQSVSGPVGIFTVVADLVKTSGGKFIVNLLNVIALLSLSLATINILPFPALDGGRLVFVLYEWITKKPVHKTLEKYVNLIGFAILILLAILVTTNDIIRLIK